MPAYLKGLTDVDILFSIIIAPTSVGPASNCVVNNSFLVSAGQTGELLKGRSPLFSFCLYTKYGRLSLLSMSS